MKKRGANFVNGRKKEMPWHHMRQIGLLQFTDAHLSMFFFLKAAVQSKEMTSLAMEESQINDDCTSLLQQLLQNPHLKSEPIVDRKFRNNRKVDAILPSLQQLKQLPRLEPTLFQVNSIERKSLKRLMRKDRLHFLSLRHSWFNTKLYRALPFSHMNQLQELRILNTNIEDNTGFAGFLRSIRVLHLQA